MSQPVIDLLVETFGLKPEQLTPDATLQSLGLDSVDALQLVVALDKNYGLKIADPEAARSILQNVNTIAEAVTKHRGG